MSRRGNDARHYDNHQTRYLPILFKYLVIPIRYHPGLPTVHGFADATHPTEAPP